MRKFSYLALIIGVLVAAPGALAERTHGGIVSDSEPPDPNNVRTLGLPYGHRPGPGERPMLVPPDSTVSSHYVPFIRCNLPMLEEELPKKYLLYGFQNTRTGKLTDCKIKVDDGVFG